MAMEAKTQAILALLLLSALAIASSATGLGGGGSVVGGRTKVADVEHNKEVQELGKYSVNEYNRQQSRKGDGEDGTGAGDLKFVKVVAAETQVVSGIKYYLKIAATTSDGMKKTFDAEVVVQAWRKSKQLMKFAPSHN